MDSHFTHFTSGQYGLTLLTLLTLLQVNMVQNFPEKFVEKTLIALAINLAGS
jgi:hypothetical protein